MYPESSVWLLLGLALVGANLPFFTERFFSFVPFRLKGEPEKFVGFYLLRASAAYVVWVFAFYLLTEPGFPLAAKLVGVLVYAAMMGASGFIYAPYVQHKSIGIHVLEWLLMAVYVVGIGRFVEGHHANMAVQSWQFYAIGLAIFFVLALPGVVWRHLWRRPQMPKGLQER